MRLFLGFWRLLELEGLEIGGFRPVLKRVLIISGGLKKDESWKVSCRIEETFKKEGY